MRKKIIPKILKHNENFRKKPKSLRDGILRNLVSFMGGCADFFFKFRYEHRAIILETIAAVPGMVGGLLQHLKSLRLIKDDKGWIKTLLDEAENERMHLLIYSELIKLNHAERILVMIIQFFFYHLYFILYLISPSTAHRIVGYFEEEAIDSYERYLNFVMIGKYKNISATKTAISYWNLKPDAKLSDIISATIKDEMLHRDVNHRFADDKVGTNLWS